jgi:hypothetical protein
LIKCQCCNSTKIKALVSVEMYIDANKHYRKLSKKAISEKSTEIWGADWSKTSFVCQECGNAFGYGYENL